MPSKVLKYISSKKQAKAYATSNNYTWSANDSKNPLSEAYRQFNQNHPDEYRKYLGQKKRMRTVLG